MKFFQATTGDTGIGGSRDQFPATRWSAIVAARSDDPAERARSFEILIAAYWKPVYKYLRMKWRKSNEDAKDLTQGFFTQAMEKGYFQTYDQSKARFRTFLRRCLDGYVANEEKAASRIKRGGQALIMSLDFENAEGELKHAEIPDPETPEKFFGEQRHQLPRLCAAGISADCVGKAAGHDGNGGRIL